MHLCINVEGAWLDDRQNFRELDVCAASGALAGRLPTEAPVVEITETHAWLSVSGLRGLGAPDDPAWETGFTEMIAYADGAGWTRAGGTEVRAHLVVDAAS